MKPLLVPVALIMCVASAGSQTLENKVRMSIPGVQGVLELYVGRTMWDTQVRPDGQEIQLQAMNRLDNLIITAFLQKVSFSASPENCRADWWPATEKGMRSHDLKPEQLSQTTKDGIARVEYIVPKFRGAPIRQKTLHAYLGSRDLCAEIHLSKVQFSPDDQKLFEDVLETVRLLPDESNTKDDRDSYGYTALGSKFYVQKNYPAAAQQYQKALDLEKQKRTLDKTLFLVLVDNLGMSYGISGDLNRAKETFEYGITQYPDYPMFYYNMACTYGEMNKMNESLEQLRLAYKYKGNMIAGENLPDPLQDDSFRHFVNNKDFVAAVHEMQQQ